MDEATRHKKYRLENKEKVKIYKSKYYQDNRERVLIKSREFQQKRKLSIIKHYSLGEFKCACCGETEIGFLSIDHIGGGGTKQKKELGGGGNMIHRWITRNNFPVGFQILCYNCNMSKGALGECPHETERRLNAR